MWFLPRFARSGLCINLELNCPTIRQLELFFYTVIFTNLFVMKCGYKLLESSNIVNTVVSMDILIWTVTNLIKNL